MRTMDIDEEHIKKTTTRNSMNRTMTFRLTSSSRNHLKIEFKRSFDYAISPSPVDEDYPLLKSLNK